MAIKLLNNKNNFALAVIIFLFILLLSQGVQQIYHQDEYRWISEMNRTDVGPHVHPPLYFLMGRGFGLLLGFDHERYLLAIFGIANVILVYVVANAITRRCGVGLLAAGLFAFNAYSVLAATQIDIDGAILPFFTLLMYLAYLRVLEGRRKWFWIFGLAIIGGLLSKLSFVIGMGALTGDFCVRLIIERKISVQKLVYQYRLWLIGGLVILGGAYILLGYFMPGVISYASDHIRIFDFSHRLYMDLAFKILKSFVLLGPLLFLGGLASILRRGVWYKYRFLWLYLIGCTLFYAVIFDFTNLTIERYFMFMIAPLAILAAEPVAELLLIIRNYQKRWHVLIFSAGVVILLTYILSLSSDILPLNPKIAYVQHVLSGQWNFLIPISGGSGPIGFYVSAIFMAVVSGLSILSIIGLMSRRERIRVYSGSMFICIGVFTAIIVLSEFLFGSLYGSVPSIAKHSVDYVNNSPDIKQVITYYDIAPYDLRESGKYYSRFYTAPNRDYTKKITDFRGHYMIVNFPEIGHNNVYWKLIERCPIQKEFQDKEIRAYVFNCTKLK